MYTCNKTCPFKIYFNFLYEFVIAKKLEVFKKSFKLFKINWGINKITAKSSMKSDLKNYCSGVAWGVALPQLHHLKIL